MRRFAVVLGPLAGLLIGAATLTVQSSSNKDNGFRASLPHWLEIEPQARIRYEHRSGNAFEIDVANGLLTRYFLGVGVRPHRRFRVHVQGMDARMPTARREQLTERYRDVFDIREAYAEFGDPERDPLRVIVGRQLLVYGSERVIGRLNWSNSRRAFDAIKVRYENQTTRVDVFSGSAVRDFSDRLDRSDYGNGFHGVYSTWKRVIPGGVLDTYLLYRTRRRTTDELSRTGDGDIWALGFRLAGKLADGTDYDVDVVFERGHLAQADLSAWSIGFEAGHGFENLAAKPRLFVLYNRASGDSDPTDGRAGTFDQLFASNHRNRGLVDVIGNRNGEDFGGGIQVTPLARLTLKAQVDSFRLVNRHDGYYTHNGRVAVARVAGGAQSRQIGNEYEISGSYKLNSFTTLAAGVGRLFRGDFLKLHSDVQSSTFGYIYVEFRP